MARLSVLTAMATAINQLFGENLEWFSVPGVTRQLDFPPHPTPNTLLTVKLLCIETAYQS